MVQKLERYMENKKYYTPEISELHVGYQCDIQDYKERWTETKLKDDM